MLSRIIRIVCLVLLGLTLFSATMLAAPLVTLSVVDSDVRDVLTGMATIGKINVVIDESVSGKISVNFKNIPFESALELITRSKGLSMYRSGNVIVFSSLEKMEKGFGQVRVFPLKFARADHIKNIIVGGGKSDSEFLVENPLGGDGAQSSGGSGAGSGAGSLKGKASDAIKSSENKEGIKGLVLNTDASTNSLIAFGAPEQIDKVAVLLKELDVPYQQILLEAQVMALSKNASRELGIDWTWSQFPPPSQSSGTSGATVNYFPVGIVTGGDGKQYNLGVNAALKALITSGDGKILARPNVTTFNGNRATIFVGDQIPVPKSDNNNTGSTSSTSIEYKTAGITLSYVPRINADNQITASVFVEVSMPVADSKLASGAIVYRITTRSAQTNVRMKDGDTMVIGGLISSQDVKSLNKIPILGDLPMLGKLFQSVSKSKNETEVVIFLKAKILKPNP